jgi:hypothetical protein
VLLHELRYPSRFNASAASMLLILHNGPAAEVTAQARIITLAAANELLLNEVATGKSGWLNESQKLDAAQPQTMPRPTPIPIRRLAAAIISPGLAPIAMRMPSS